MPTLDALDTEYLIAVAREAGAAILEVYATDFEVERKSDASPLTEADLRAHRVIIARLSERYPDIPILSEESAEHDAYERRKEWDRFWLVDPLDGTKEFIKRNGQFTVNIALIEDGRPRAGVVYAPALDLLYWGEVEQGAFKKEAGGSAVALGPPTHKPREKLIIAGSLSHPTPEMDAFLDEQHALYKEVEFVAMGSSLKLCMVADGSADVYPRFRTDDGMGHGRRPCCRERGGAKGPAPRVGRGVALQQARPPQRLVSGAVGAAPFAPKGLSRILVSARRLAVFSPSHLEVV